MSTENKPLHWWIQKSISNNCCHKQSSTVHDQSAVFQDFKPTMAISGCEWKKVIDANAYDELKEEVDESHPGNFKRYMEMTLKYNTLEKERDQWKAQSEKLVEALTEVLDFQHIKEYETIHGETECSAYQDAVSRLALSSHEKFKESLKI